MHLKPPFIFFPSELCWKRLFVFIVMCVWCSNKYMLFTGREIRLGKNCAQGPRAVLKTKGTVFSHTGQPCSVNNIFIFFRFLLFKVGKEIYRHHLVQSFFLRIVKFTSTVSALIRTIIFRLHIFHYTGIFTTNIVNINTFNEPPWLLQRGKKSGVIKFEDLEFRPLRC